VIRQFLDAQRVSNLTLYLEQLHTRGHATPAHTALLLTCYTKLKLTHKLNAFVAQRSVFSDAGGLIYDPIYVRHVQRAHEVVLPKNIATCMSSQSQSQPHHASAARGRFTRGGRYDVLSAITSYRDCSYDLHARFLALLYGVYHVYLALLLEAHEYTETIRLLSSLPPHLAYFLLLQHGSALVDSPVRDAVTGLCIQLCTGTFVQQQLHHTVTLPVAAGDNGAGGPQPAATPAPSVTIAIDPLGRAVLVSGTDAEGAAVTPEDVADDGQGDGQAGNASSASATPSGDSFSLTSTLASLGLGSRGADAPAAAAPAEETLSLEDFGEKEDPMDPLVLLRRPMITPHALFNVFAASQEAFLVFLEALAAHDVAHGLEKTLAAVNAGTAPGSDAATAAASTSNSVVASRPPEEFRVRVSGVWNTLLEAYLALAHQHGALTGDAPVDGLGHADGQAEHAPDTQLRVPLVVPYTTQSPQTLYGLVVGRDDDAGVVHAEFAHDVGADAGSSVPAAPWVEVTSGAFEKRVLLLLQLHCDRLDTQHAMILLEASSFRKGLQLLHTRTGASQVSHRYSIMILFVFF
jgi:hypothetical protein